MGGGEVVRKVDSRRWLVRTEDGFELPMYESELVVDSPPELVTLSNKPTEKKTTPVQTEVASARVVQEPTEKVQLQRNLLTHEWGAIVSIWDLLRMIRRTPFVAHICFISSMSRHKRF